MASYPADSEPLPHHSIDAEQQLLGAMLIDNRAMDMAAPIVQADHLFEPIHREIYREAERLRGLGKVVTPVTLHDAFPAGQKVENLTLKQYLARLAAEATTLINVPDFAQIIRTTAILRDIARMSDTVKFSKHRGLSSEAALEQAWQEIDRIRLGAAQHTGRTSTLAESIRQVASHVGGIMSGEKNPNGVATGLIDLDTKMGGFMAGDLVLIAGRPGSGKSTLAASLARQISCRVPLGDERDGVGLFSLEMPQMQTTARIVSDYLYDLFERGRGGVMVPYKDIIRGLRDLSLEEGMRIGGLIHDAREELEGMPLIIDDSSRPSMSEIAAKVRDMKHRCKKVGAKLKVAVIDYLKYVKPSDRYAGHRVHEFGEISRGCKQLAKDEDICVVLLVQLSRKVEERESKRPMLSDLRDCLAGESLVTDADTGDRVPIREIAERGMRFNVWAMGADMKLHKRRISDAWAVKVQPVYRLVTRLGREIRCSGGHRFRIASGEWKPVREIARGTVIALPRLLGEPVIPSTMSVAQASILGWLLGDGYFGGSAALTVSTEDEAEIAVAMAKEAFPELQPYWKDERKDTPAKRVFLTTGQLCGAGKNTATRWLRGLGLWGIRGAGKFIPPEVFRQPNEVVAACLRGLFHADGGIVGGAKEIKLVSISERLVRDAQHLLLRLGINASVRSNLHRASGFRPSTSVIWTLAISGRGPITSFMKNVGFLGRKHDDAIAGLPTEAKKGDTGHVDRLPREVSAIVAGWKAKRNLSHRDLGWCDQGKMMSRATAGMLAITLSDPILEMFANSDLIWDEVKSIDLVGDEMTYDLVVSDLHNFVVDGFITHNSGELEEDADVVLLCYREAYYLINDPRSADLGERIALLQNDMEVNIAKQRNGPPGPVKVWCSMATASIRNMARQQAGAPATRMEDMIDPSLAYD